MTSIFVKFWTVVMLHQPCATCDAAFHFAGFQSFEACFIEEVVMRTLYPDALDQRCRLMGQDSIVLGPSKDS